MTFLSSKTSNSKPKILLRGFKGDLTITLGYNTGYEGIEVTFPNQLKNQT